MYVWTNMAPQTMVHGLSRGGVPIVHLGPIYLLTWPTPPFSAKSRSVRECGFSSGNLQPNLQQAKICLVIAFERSPG